MSSKKYVNKTNIMRTVLFEDGTAQFLMRGQSFVSDRKPVKVQEGVVIRDLPVSKQPESKNRVKNLADQSAE